MNSGTAETNHEESTARRSFHDFATGAPHGFDAPEKACADEGAAAERQQHRDRKAPAEGVQNERAHLDELMRIAANQQIVARVERDAMDVEGAARIDGGGKARRLDVEGACRDARITESSRAFDNRS